MAKNEQKMPLPKLDNLFTTQKERDEANLEKVCELPLTKLHEFPKHPFKVIVNEEMEKMAESVREHGVLSPILVRPLENGEYQMIAGHRRKKASEMANKETIPCIIRNLTDDEATIIMVDSNLQREHILPSERAFAYKMKLEAMKHQGKKIDIAETSNQVGGKSNESASIIGKKNGDSLSQVRRYIRLTELVKPLLDMVDNENIAFSPAVEISYLSKEEQEWLLDSIESSIATPSLSQAQELKRLSQSGKLDKEIVDDILSQQKANQILKLKLDLNSLKPKMPKGMPEDRYMEHIFKALDYYNRHLERQREMRTR